MSEPVDFKLGKLAATKPFGVGTMATYSIGKLPAPPARVHYGHGVDLPIDGNDQYGDCVMAGTAHMIALWNHEVAEHLSVPTGQEVVEEYFKLTDGADSGLNENDVLHTWAKQGLFGQKIAAYVPVDTNSVLDLHAAVAFYGCSMLGIAVPESAQEQFQKNEPWTVVPGSPILGGHCIVACGYDEQYVYCATWGGIAPVTYPFLAKFMDEAWAAIPEAYVEAKKGPMLDLATLQKDLGLL